MWMSSWGFFCWDSRYLCLSLFSSLADPASLALRGATPSTTIADLVIVCAEP